MDNEPDETWEELISERVFGQEIPPRWVLAVSRDQLLLIDRQKWAASTTIQARAAARPQLLTTTNWRWATS
jgi:hypothetical protein